MPTKLFALFAVSLALVLPSTILTSSADAKPAANPVAKDPLAARKAKSKAATKSSGAGSKYMKVKNNASKGKKKK